MTTRKAVHHSTLPYALLYGSVLSGHMEHPCPWDTETLGHRDTGTPDGFQREASGSLKSPFKGISDVALCSYEQQNILRRTAPFKGISNVAPFSSKIEYLAPRCALEGLTSVPRNLVGLCVFSSYSLYVSCVACVQAEPTAHGARRVTISTLCVSSGPGLGFL